MSRFFCANKDRHQAAKVEQSLSLKNCRIESLLVSGSPRCPSTGPGRARSPEKRRTLQKPHCLYLNGFAVLKRMLNCHLKDHQKQDPRSSFAKFMVPLPDFIPHWRSIVQNRCLGCKVIDHHQKWPPGSPKEKSGCENELRKALSYSHLCLLGHCGHSP